ncbi:MAG: twin-arginine translocase TatA/TatE family subunit [Halanaeroarchaeum sp.]
MTAPLPLFLGMPGGMELMIVLFLAILLFGANKIPQLARSSGQAMGEFKRGRAEIESEIKRTVEEGQSEALVREDDAEAAAETSEADAVSAKA